MKANKFAALKDIIKTGDEKKQIKIIYQLALASLLCTLFLYKISENGGPSSYFEAGYNIFNGKLDAFRTPVFPILCYICDNLSHRFAYEILCVINILAFLCSIKYFYRLNTILFNHGTTTFIVTTLYATLPYFNTYVTLPITETISLSLLVLFVYTNINAMEGHGAKYICGDFIIFFLLLFIRPSFVFLIPIVLLLNAYEVLKHRNIFSLINIVCSFIVVLLFCGYCAMMKQQYNVFGPSTVSYENNWAILRHNNLVDSKLIDDRFMKTDVDSMLKVPTTYQYHYMTDIPVLIKKYGTKNTYAMVSEQVDIHKMEMLKCGFKRFLTNSNQSCLGVYAASREGGIGYLLNCFIFPWLSISFLTLYVILLISVIMLKCSYRRESTRTIKFLFLWAVVLANMVTVVLGAQDEYFRLLLPCTPYVVCLIFFIYEKSGLAVIKKKVLWK